MLNPEQTCHPFWSKAATYSGVKEAIFSRIPEYNFYRFSDLYIFKPAAIILYSNNGGKYGQKEDTCAKDKADITIQMGCRSKQPGNIPAASGSPATVQDYLYRAKRE